MTDTVPQVSVQGYIRSGIAQQLIEDTLKDGAQEFTTSLLAVVNSNSVLQSCEPISIIKAGMTAAAMKLSIEPGLGLAAIVPYNTKVKTKKIITKPDGSTYEKTIESWVMQAQFQMMTKGFKQLALRTGEYKLINETEVRDGEYKGVDRLTGEYSFKWIKKDDSRDKKEVIGYVAFIELKTGYRKALYMTVAQLKAHASKYSKSYQKGYGQWIDDFDVMARKTVMKLLISKHGIITTQMAKAIVADQSSVGDTYDYVDNKPDAPAAPAQPPQDNFDGIDQTNMEDTDE